MFRGIYADICGGKPKVYPPDHVIDISVYSGMEPKKGMRVSPISVKGILDNTLEILLDANFKHDEILLSSALLQAMALTGRTKGQIKDLSHEPFVPKHINPMLDKIYDYTADNYSTIPHLLGSIYKDVKKEVAERNTEQAQSQPTNISMSQLRLRAEDIYFEKGLATRFVDVMLSLPTISAVLDNVNGWIKTNNPEDPETIHKYISWILMSVVQSARHVQEKLGFIDDTSSKLSRPLPGQAKSIGTLLNQINGLEDPGDNPEGY